MAAVSQRIVVALVAVWAAGCNLTLDVQEYPYSGGADVVVPDVDTPDAAQDAADAALDAAPEVGDVGDADAADAQPSGKPYLIFTELMPDVTTPPNGSVETGEYVEVKNIGTAPADPRRIIIQLAGSNRLIQVNPFPVDEEGRRVFEQLQDIAPGEYFVFVRQDSNYYKLTAGLAEGTYYEYGRWSDAVPLSNSTRRLVLSYRTDEFHRVQQDAIEWASHSLIDPAGGSDATLALREDAAWGVMSEYEDAHDNDDPAHWCYHVDPLPDSPIKASPGAPTPANCTTE